MTDKYENLIGYSKSCAIGAKDGFLSGAVVGAGLFAASAAENAPDPAVIFLATVFGGGVGGGVGSVGGCLCEMRKYHTKSKKI